MNDLNVLNNLLVPAVSDMPDVTGEKMATGARHRFSLEITFRVQKATAKLLNDAFYGIFYYQIKNLLGSDPEIIADY